MHSNMLENLETAKLIVTSKTLYGARRTLSALKRAVPGAHIRRTGLKGIFVLEAEGEPLELARRVWDLCAGSIGRAVAVLAEVESAFSTILESAVRIGSEQIGEAETFCFRLHKRGTHGLDLDTPKIESQIGGAIWLALQERHGRPPSVDLKNPDVTVVAEVLGANTALGITRKAWRSL